MDKWFKLFAEVEKKNWQKSQLIRIYSNFLNIQFPPLKWYKYRANLNYSILFKVYV